MIPVSESAPAACARKFSAWFAVESDDDPRAQGDSMSNTIQHPSAIVAIKTHHLHDIDNDTKCRLYSGTVAMASITGASMSRVRDAVRLARHGAGWVDRRRAPAVTKTSGDEIESTLRLL
ncbi:MAG TPA: hypothetical protein DEQ45_17135, partial [Agrobacterium sp.]|nr:hypothetical protein [Agrobacterium sp.]